MDNEIKSKEKCDPADFIIEKFMQMQPTWGNSRITYRLYRWVKDTNTRKNFEGDFFWIGNLYSRLRDDFGFAKEEIESIPIVDLIE